MMPPVFIDGIGIRGPGLNGWAESRRILAQPDGYAPADTIVPVVELLPPAERRRTPATVKMALAVAMEAAAAAGQNIGELASVFAASGGDGATVHEILEALALPEREVSPTRFHNSVHNAASGYWTLAAQCRAPSTAICAFDESFIVGLIDAAAQAAHDQCPVLLEVHDYPYPEPLRKKRPIATVFGVALVLNYQRSARSLARLSIDADSSLPITTVADIALDSLRLDNPSARGLPLLMALARHDPATTVLENVAGHVALTLDQVTGHG